MKKIRETQVFLPGVKCPVLAFTDLHFSEHFGEQRLEKLLEVLRAVIQREEIEYVCFLGDLVDSLMTFDDIKLRQKLGKFLKKLAEKLPVIMVLGNHDESRYVGRTALLDKVGFKELKQELRKITGVVVLGGEEEVFDDGKVRMLGIDLPEECYHFSNFQSQKSAVEMFREKMMESLPKLETNDRREKYLLLHSSRFLREVEIPGDVIVLSGHMHDGAVPAVLDKMTKFSDRGIVGPGFSKGDGRQSHYEFLPWNARLRPREGRIWLSLRPVNYLPRNRKIGKLNRLFPELSYTVIKGGAGKVRVEEKLF